MTTDNATKQENNSIPIIDLGLPSEEQIINDLLDALKTIGFATLINHGVASDLLERTFAASRAFFDMPTETKLQYKFQGHASNRGYIPLGSETLDTVDGTTMSASMDHKESLEIGKEGEAGYANQWPTELQDTFFQADLLEYFTAMDQLHLRIMRWIAMGLGLPHPDYLVERCNGQHENLRLLHYPALTTTTGNATRQRANVHTDYGTITLLAQDQVGGLKVQRVDGTWMFVTPIPNALVLNVGDMLMRWSNDVLKATLHQVVSPPASCRGGGAAPERYSVVFFCNANKETLLECLEACRGEDGAKYLSITAHEYITKRLAETIQAS